MVSLKQKSFSQLGECFGSFIPGKYLRPTKKGSFSRQRVFNYENTFWAFLSQVLDADGGCQEVVRKIQAHAALKSMPLPASSTAAYCKARQKLDRSDLEAILNHTARQLKNSAKPSLMNGRRVIKVDGTGVSMPDTPSNQAATAAPKNRLWFSTGLYLRLFLPANWRVAKSSSR